MFNSIFGEDTKVLKNNEDLVSYFQEKFNELYNENESPETYFENLIYDVREHNPQDILLSNEIAKKVKIKRINHKKKGLLSFQKKDQYHDLFFLIKIKRYKTFRRWKHLEFLKLKKMKNLSYLIKNTMKCMKISNLKFLQLKK